MLYAAELEEDRRRYRYLATSGGREVKWLPLPHGKTNSSCRSKVTSELIQLLRQLLSIPSDKLSPCALKAVEEFFSKRAGHGSQTDPPQPSLPLTGLVYRDPALLSKLLTLLNSLDTEDSSPPPSGKGSLVAPNLTATLFVNFAHFLDLHCPDHSCFFQPIMGVLGSGGGEQPLSTPFLSFVGRLTSELARQKDLAQLVQFVELGGAKLMFECLVRSCQHSQFSSQSSLMSTIARLGQREAPKPFQDSSQLVNFLPLASIQLSPDRTPIHDLQLSNLTELPSRSSTFHHTFHSKEEELVLTATLPYPILFRALQLFQPMGLLQNGPSSLLIETSSRPGLAPPLPATPLISTKGLGCVKVELQSPLVVQEVKVHLYRPAVSDSISLSHMHLLGTGYGGTLEEGEGRKAESRGEKTHPR